MKHIEFTQQNVEKLNVEHMDLSSKVTLLQNNQLILKIESLSKLLEELLHRISENDKEIVNLKKELEVHKKVENSLADKNKHFLNAINKLTGTIHKLQTQDSEKLKSNSIKEKERDFSSLKENVNKNVSINNSSSNNDINFRTSNSKIFNRSNSLFFLKEIQNQTIDKGQNQIGKLEKQLDKKKKEYEFLQTKYDLIQEKFILYEQKISNIYKLTETVLNDFSKDPTIINNNEIIIQSERIKNADFDSLTKEEKYSLLSILMKRLIPFIISEKVEENENLKNIKLQYQTKCLNMSSSSFSENNTKSMISNRLGKSFSKKINFSKEIIGLKKRNEPSKYKFPDNPSIF